MNWQILGSGCKQTLKKLGFVGVHYPRDNSMIAPSIQRYGEVSKVDFFSRIAPSIQLHEEVLMVDFLHGQE